MDPVEIEYYTLSAFAAKDYLYCRYTSLYMDSVIIACPDAGLSCLILHCYSPKDLSFCPQVKGDVMRGVETHRWVPGKFSSSLWWHFLNASSGVQHWGLYKHMVCGNNKTASEILQEVQAFMASENGRHGSQGWRQGMEDEWPHGRSRRAWVSDCTSLSGRCLTTEIK